MEYTEEIAAAMLADPRWVGAVTEKMCRVWKSRGKIPKQYFHPKYVQYSKANDPRANQIRDPYFNPDFVLRVPMTEAEIVQHDRVVDILRSEKLFSGRFLSRLNIPKSLFFDASRAKDDPRFVRMRAEHVRLLRNEVQALRVKMKAIVDAQGPRIVGEAQKKRITELFSDDRIVLATTIGYLLYDGRMSERTRGRPVPFEDAEADYIAGRLAVFLLETAL